MEEQFQLLNKSPLNNNKDSGSIKLDDDEEWIVLNEIVSSPFYTGNFNGDDELEAVSVNEFLLNSPSLSPSPSPSSPQSLSSINSIYNSISTQELDDDAISLEPNDSQSKPYESLILTPEFLISLNVFTNNMSWLSKEVALKCVQSSQSTTNKIISISQIIKNQCRAIASITTSNSYLNYGSVHI